MIPRLSQTAALCVSLLCIAKGTIMGEDTVECLQSWHIERAGNPWAGLTSSAQAEARSLVVKPGAVDLEAENLIGQFRAEKTNETILFRAKGANEIFVNQRYFSQVARVDATKSIVDRHEIGHVTPLALKTFGPEEILEILLKYELIRTYAHLEADVCLVSAQRLKDNWMADIRGQHTYYTSKKHVKGYEFRFELNLKTGNLAVLPALPH
jgi:hypothetical protein